MQLLRRIQPYGGWPCLASATGGSTLYTTRHTGVQGAGAAAWQSSPVSSDAPIFRGEDANQIHE